MRYKQVAVGIGMSALVGALGIYAASDDSYYGDGTSHWEHATRDGGAWFLAALFVIASVISLGVVLRGLRNRKPGPPLAVLALALYPLSLLVLYTVLSVGH
jgi:hypothetical protein